MTYRSILAAGVAAMALAAAGHAFAQSKTLYVGMNGGNFEKTFTQAVFPDFEKANDVKVVVVPGTSSDILAKATAAKDKPQMHVMFLDDGVMVRAIGAGLCEKLKNGPEMADLAPGTRMKDDMAVGIDLGMTGLGYNKKLFDEKGWPAPTSWMDLADPKYKGKVVFQSASASSFGLHAFLMFNRIQGGTEANVEPGFTKFRDTIGKNVLEFIPSSAKIAEMAQTGEAAIFPLTPTGISTLKDKGIAVEETRADGGTYRNLLELSIAASGGRTVVTVCGTVTEEGRQRVVKLDGYPIEFVPDGVVLLFSNHDRPGVIGKVGTLLGEAGSNIANFALGRKNGSGLAVAALQIDNDVPDKVVETFKADADLLWAVKVDFSEAAR